MSNRGPQKKLRRHWKCSNPACAKEFTGTKWELMQSLGVKSTPFHCTCGSTFTSTILNEEGK